jgi:hypothetical protein
MKILSHLLSRNSRFVFIRLSTNQMPKGMIDMMTPTSVDCRSARFLAIAFLIAQASILAAGQDATYNFSQTLTTGVPSGSYPYSGYPLGTTPQTDSITGSITTNGTIGTLTAADIVSWNIHLTDDFDSANDYNLTPSDSTPYVEGNALSGTATDLSFDFGASGEFFILADSPGLGSGYHYFCYSTDRGDCWAGETIAPALSTTDGVLLANPSSLVATGGTQAVPESPSIPMFFLSLAVLGAAFALKLLTSEKFRPRSRLGLLESFR